MSLKVLLLSVVIATASANILGNIQVDLDSPKVDTKIKYEAWKVKYNKVYATLEEEAKAMDTFAANDKFVILSSMRCFFSIISTSVAAPTLMTATPEARRVILSCSLSHSWRFSVCSISFLTAAILVSISSQSPLPPTTVVQPFVMLTDFA